MKFFLFLITGVIMSQISNADVEPSVHVTYIGTASILLEIGDQKPFRILTDPVFDEPGTTYPLGFGYKTKKLHGPAVAPQNLPPIDLILLSHDGHADNLDIEGRRFLPKAKKILTTNSGASRLNKDKKLKFSSNQVSGLSDWKSLCITTQEGWALKVTAIPGQHSPSPLLAFIAGEVIGFVLEWEGQSRGVTYLTGDTVYLNTLKAVASSKYFKNPNDPTKSAGVENLFLHLAAVRFSVTFCGLWTMGGAEGAHLIQDLKPLRVLPLHFDGWSHFGESWKESEKKIAPVISSMKEKYKTELQLLVPGRLTKLISP